MQIMTKLVVPDSTAGGGSDAGSSIARCGIRPGHARRGGGGHESPPKPACACSTRRQRRGCRHRHHAGRLGHRVLALRPGRRSAHPGAHQGRARSTPSPAWAPCRNWPRPISSATTSCSPTRLSIRPRSNGLKDWVPVAGILPALVPGMVDAALVTLREFGTKSFAEAVEPAIELADGFPHRRDARDLARSAA